MKKEKKKILVVDDAKFMIAAITRALPSEDYNVVSATSGEEALEKVKTELPDLILLDVVLPNMSGYDVCATLRNNFRYSLIPIIMLTGQTEEEDKLKGLELGADDYIIKPFVGRELVARVKNTLVRLERIREVNPITGLRGNNEIEMEIARRINANTPFAVLYLDLNEFKPYNDVYGFANGDIAIKKTANLISDCVEKNGSSGDFVGHIGGDDFVVIVEPESAIPISESIISEFEIMKLTLYSTEDQEKGFITAEDRSGVVKTFGLIGISVAIVNSLVDYIPSMMELASVAATLKKKAKSAGKSAYATSQME